MNRYAHSIFCDDIRNEVNSKISLMGIFGPLLYVSEFPCALPKLCAVITATTELDNPFKTLSFKGLLNDVVIFDIDLAQDQLELIHANRTLLNDPKGFSAQAMVVLSPLNLESAGLLKVKVIADGEEINCPGLQISLAPEGVQVI